MGTKRASFVVAQRGTQAACGQVRVWVRRSGGAGACCCSERLRRFWGAAANCPADVHIHADRPADVNTTPNSRADLDSTPHPVADLDSTPNSLADFHTTPNSLADFHTTPNPLADVNPTPKPLADVNPTPNTPLYSRCGCSGRRRRSGRPDRMLAGRVLHLEPACADAGRGPGYRHRASRQRTEPRPDGWHPQPAST